MKNSKNNKYKIGIYGTRNVCSRVGAKGCAVRSFVSDMSTGFSGNLGFTIPNNWAVDQFATVTVGTGTGQIEIDKDGYSGLDEGIGFIDNSSEEPIITPEPDYTQLIGYDTLAPQGAVMVNTLNKPINVFVSKAKGVANVSPAKEELESATYDLGFYLPNPSNTNLWGVTGNKVGEIKPGDLFVRFECRNHAFDGYPDFIDRIMNEGDSVHKVLFRNSDGVVRYGYIQEVITATGYNIEDSLRAGKENFFYYNFDSEQNKLVKNNVLTPSEAVHTVKRELEYTNSVGNKIGDLEIGTELNGAGNAGSSKPEYMYFQKQKKVGSNEWKDLDIENKAGAFVNLDMQNGVNGYDRSLW